MESRYLFKAVLRGALLAFLFSGVSCNSPWFDPIEKGNNNNGEEAVIADCNLSGTMIRVPCGTSIYDNLWIRTDNGKLVRPCLQSFRPICPIVLKVGNRVKFSYRNLSSGESCTDAIGCTKNLPLHQKAVIDCITLDNGRNPSDTLPGTLTLGEQPQERGIKVIDATISGTVLSLIISYPGCSEYENNDFNLVWDRNITREDPGRTTLWITHTKNNSCEAYFKKQLKFDIEALHEKFKGPLQITIQDKELKF